MVFSSSPLFVDPPNWNQQGGSNNNIVVAEEEGIHELPEPHEGGAGANTSPVVVVSMAERARLAKIPQVEAALKCPRCDSSNTKFCYFNNYSLTQPRHFCKTCRRYWTRGGALRTVPVGGGCRRNKRGSNNKSSSSSSTSSNSKPSTVPITPPSAPPQFLAPWHHLPADYGFQQPIVHTMPENINIGLMEQWRIQQFPFLGGLVEEPSSLPLYPFEGELAAGRAHGQGKIIMSTVKMEETSQAAAAATAATNMPRQFFSDGQIWPAGGDQSGSGHEGHGGGWIN